MWKKLRAFSTSGRTSRTATSGRTARGPRDTGRGFVPHVELLESRSLPSIVTGPGSTAFDPGHILVGTATGIQRMALAAGDTVEQALAGFRGRGDVLFAEPDYLVHATDIPDDPLFGQLYGLHNTGQSGGLVDADIDAPEAWNLTTGSTRTVVGVIDTGVDYRHRDLYLQPGGDPRDHGITGRGCRRLDYFPGPESLRERGPRHRR
jgi:hypothetical protein